MEHLIEVSNLKTEFHIDGNVIKAVDDVSYYVNEGEIVSFVGESGCGKSVTHLSTLQLIPNPPGKIVSGKVLYKNIDILQLMPDSEQLRTIRGGEIGFVFQEPMTSLNPVLTIGEQIIEAVTLHMDVDRKVARKRAIEMINKVGIPDADLRVDDYPHQFSGGMRQRIMIAMALSAEPRILIADEATTALDVTTQAQILEMLRDIVKNSRTALIIVTHNLGVVARYAERIYVMYAGNIVEVGTTHEIFYRPSHPYTIGLLNAIPRLDDPKERKLVPIEGTPPSLLDKPDRCAFLPRCAYHTDICQYKPFPGLKPSDFDNDHFVACYVNARELNLGRKSKDIAKDANKHDYIPKEANAVRYAEEIILEVSDLKVYFPVTKGLLRRKVADVKAVDGVSFILKKGETLGLVGESGCGKTTVARAILRLYDITSGKIVFQNQNIAKLPKRELGTMRRNMSIIFQDPYSSLNPRQRAGDIVGEPLVIHKLSKDIKEYNEKVDRLFHMVGLDPGLKYRVPHEFSGGQRQRIGIARALASSPSLIVCDEAISALDVSIQAQIINLLVELQSQFNLSYLFIAHDLSVVRHISDRVAVMYLGRIVEIAKWNTIYENPLHPYTQGLLHAIPIADPVIEAKREHVLLKGEVPSLLKRPSGCVFHNRCPLVSIECKTIDPHLKDFGNGHGVACIKV